METKGVRIVEAKPHYFSQTVSRAQSGDKESMEEILNLFAGDIEYLAKFIMLPKEEAIQTLRIELINIVHENL